MRRRDKLPGHDGEARAVRQGRQVTVRVARGLHEIASDGLPVNREFREAVARRPVQAAKSAAGIGPMRDFAADWKKWSRAERVFAVLVTLMLVALPLGLLLTGKAGV